MLSRRIILPIIILLAGGLYLLTRDPLWPLLGGILILYHEQRLQTQLLELQFSQRKPTTEPLETASAPEEADAQVPEPEAIPEELPPNGPGYALTEPEFVTSRWNETPSSEDSSEN